jgi:hypothetical protein
MTIVPLVVGYFAIQWNRANFLGKSPEQIVAMGRDKWTELYGKKFGDGTHQSSEAQEKFGIALQNLNDRAIQRLPKTRQVWLKEIRQTTREYAVEAHQIGSNVSGGGTMWQTFDATILPDVEQAISDCIINKPLPPVRLKSFESEFQLLDKVVLEAKSKESPQEFSDLMKHRTTLANKQNKLLTLLEKGRPNDATRFKIYMHRKIEVARGDDM